MTAKQVARGLGWFSIGLGVVEVVAPGRLLRFLGVGEEGSGIVRAYGLREIVAGLGLLTQPAAMTTWVWSRVAGDVLDLATLGGAKTEDHPTARKRSGNALAMVTAITVVDVLVARALTLEETKPRTLTERLFGRGKRS